MPRSNVSKVDILARVYKLKTALYDGVYEGKSGDWYEGSHDSLNKVLDILNEYAN
jgi:hypothetical protein